MTEKQLEKVISDALFGEPLKGRNLVIYTGHGGCKEFVKEFYLCVNPDKTYTWRKMRNTYTFLVACGSIIKVGNGYKIC